MLLPQVLASLVLWLVVGWTQARSAGALRTRMSLIPRKTRTIIGPIALLAGAVVLLAGVGLVALIHGLTPRGLTVLGWLIVTFAGVIFVQLQMLAAMMMVSLATESEPAGSREASDRRINDRNSV